MRKKKLKVKVIGCGGIGLCLLNVLPRYLNYEEQFVTEITLIDGDEYEDRNRERQSFIYRGNKAEVTAERIRNEFGNLMCTVVPDFLNETNIKPHIKDGDVVFLCVDNHATRKLLTDRCEQLKNVVLINGSNEYTDGNVNVYVKEKGEEITEPMTKRHVEIREPRDNIPVSLDHVAMCQRVAAQGAPQLLIMNNMIAAMMLNAFYGWKEGVFKDGNKKYDEVSVDITYNKSNPIKRS